MPSPGHHPWFHEYPISHENVLWHWNQATQAEKAHGMRWYADAHRVARAIAGGDAHLGAGMLATYSPQQQWTTTILNAARVLRDGQGNGGPGSGMFASTSQRNAANRLLNGEPYESILTGPKIRDFAHLIEFSGDRDPNNPRVVIDRHALSVAHGRALTSDEYGTAPLKGRRRADGSIMRHHYDYVVAVYHRAAKRINARTINGVRPYQVQATTWLVRRRLNQNAEQMRDAVLDRGRQRARANAEHLWNHIRRRYYPQLKDEESPADALERIS